MEPVRVIDADGHVLEPADLWERYVDRAFRDRAPRLSTDAKGFEILVIEDRAYGRGSLGGTGTCGQKLSLERLRATHYRDGRPGGFDPHARIQDMDLDGIQVSLLYPSLGLLLGGIQDPALAVACCRAYNDWLSEFCQAFPQRLYGVAVMPFQDVAGSIREMERALERLALRGVFIRPNPYCGRNLEHPDYVPFWDAAQTLGVPVSIHEGITANMPVAGAERFKNPFFTHMISHPFEQQIACMSLIAGGVLERFPRLRFVFLESGCGWAPYWLERMDEHRDTFPWLVPDLARRPSEYFQRQCFISCDPEENAVAHTIEVLGADKILFASDYPHIDAVFPGAVAALQNRSNLTPASKRRLLGANTARLYGLD